MKDGVQSIVAAAAVAYDPKSGLEPVRTALDNLKHALERLDRSAALDIQSLAELVGTHQGNPAYRTGYDHGHAQGYHVGLAKAMTIIEVELDKLAAEGNKN